jgi:hypothetical protein
VAKHLTDKEKKKVIAEYVSCGNYSEVARKFGLSVSGAKKIITGNPDSVKKYNNKKKENDLDMIAYLEHKKDTAQNIISKILNNLDNDELLKKASIREQATVMAILTDKFIIPHTTRITKIDDEHYEENKEALRDKLVKELGNNNDKV